MAELIRSWRILAIGLGCWWAAYLAFDLVPPILLGKEGVYLINARFLRDAVPRCLAKDDWVGCFGILVSRINAVEVYSRLVIVLIAGAGVNAMHQLMWRRYRLMSVVKGTGQP